MKREEEGGRKSRGRHFRGPSWSEPRQRRGGGGAKTQRKGRVKRGTRGAKVRVAFGVRVSSLNSRGKGRAP